MQTGTDFITHFINKTADFRYDGVDLSFDLSQSLFSSFDVDEGSKLLLKTVAQRVDCAKAKSLLDFGCGVGTLGVSVLKRHPHLAASFLDRDALALAVTGRNLAKNKCAAAALIHSCGITPVPAETCDLVLSNLPAKAGNPVLEKLVPALAGLAGPQGIVAVVVVKTLENLIREAVGKAGATLLYEEAARGHTVFHYRPGERRALPISLSDFFRAEPLVASPAGKYRIRTVYGLPEFDALSYPTRLLLELAARRRHGSEIFVWNPGQGHCPVALARGNRDCRVTIGSRDSLSLAATEQNLKTAGLGQGAVRLQPASGFYAADGRFDLVLVFPDRDPGVPWDRVLIPKALSLLAPGGVCGISAKSSFVFNALAALPHLRPFADKKHRGFRAVLLAAQDPKP